MNKSTEDKETKEELPIVPVDKQPIHDGELQNEEGLTKPPLDNDVPEERGEGLEAGEAEAEERGEGLESGEAEAEEAEEGGETEDGEEGRGEDIPTQKKRTMVFKLIIKTIPGTNIAEQYIHDIMNRLNILKIPYSVSVLNEKKHNHKMVGGKSQATFPFNLIEDVASGANKITNTKEERKSIFANLFSTSIKEEEKVYEKGYEKEELEIEEEEVVQREIEINEREELVKIRLEIRVSERRLLVGLGISELESWLEGLEGKE